MVIEFIPEAEAKALVILEETLLEQTRVDFWSDPEALAMHAHESFEAGLYEGTGHD